MKKFIIASLAIIAFASCKKDYTCECTETGAGGTDVTSTTFTDVSMFKKKHVKNSSDCVSYEQQYTDNSGMISTYDVDCTFKKD